MRTLRRATLVLKAVQFAGSGRNSFVAPFDFVLFTSQEGLAVASEFDAHTKSSIARDAAELSSAPIVRRRSHNHPVPHMHDVTAKNYRTCLELHHCTTCSCWLPQGCSRRLEKCGLHSRRQRRVDGTGEAAASEREIHAGAQDRCGTRAARNGEFSRRIRSDDAKWRRPWVRTASTDAEATAGIPTRVQLSRRMTSSPARCSIPLARVVLRSVHTATRSRRSRQNRCRNICAWRSTIVSAFSSRKNWKACASKNRCFATAFS